jgi:cytidine deaminase
MIIKRRAQITNLFHELKKSNHMCAIIDINGNPLIFGYNYYNIKNNKTTHAEVDAFNKLLNKFGHMKRKMLVDIIIIRTNGGNSLPCEKCQQKLFDVRYNFHIRNIYYTCNDYDIDVIKFSQL